MTTQQTFRQANAFAMLDGLKFGLYWCFGFFCIIKGLGNDSLASMGLLATVTAPIFGGYLAYRFGKQVRPDGPVSYGKAYLYTVLLYLYASIILSIVAFVYFNWFDHGQFVDQYLAIFNSPEGEALLQEAEENGILGTAMTQNGFDSFEEMMRSIKPVDVAAGLFNSNILIGLLMAIPTALFGKTK